MSYPEVIIDLNDTAYQVVEHGGFVAVCAEISDGLLERSVEVSLTTSDGLATGTVITPPFKYWSVVTRIFHSAVIQANGYACRNVPVPLVS